MIVKGASYTAPCQIQKSPTAIALHAAAELGVVLAVTAVLHSSGGDANHAQTNRELALIRMYVHVVT
jgi:hypothetical protein